ncbi:somatostatin receptor type 4-like [Dermacentor andersoni]|uniref:somatostatin receptor type 4-like n=1 Tax=Dermacentor andersoni TaxID=34620 RepID=UPI002155EDC3|nr:somatostatin receptor type 4-like [Dermacentor andersoni]
MEFSWSGRQLPYSPDMDGIGPLFYVAFAVLLVSGVVGNMSVVLMACCYGRVRTPAGLYVVNVAVADLLICAFGVLLDPVSVLLRRWPFGVALCYACSFSEHLGVFVHGYTLVVAAARFVAGTPPKPGSCHLNNVGVWFLGAVICLPHMLLIDSRALAVHGQCVVKWPGTVKMLEPFVSFAALAALPFLLVTVSYAWLRASLWLGRGTRRSFVRRASIVRVFWLMSLLLLLCRTPLHVTRCLLGVWTAMRASTHLTVVALATRAIAAAVVCFTAAFFFDLSAKQLARRVRQAPSVVANHAS